MTIRILQVVGGMNRGGAETWLMHILRHIDRSAYQMDFLVHDYRPYSYSAEIESLGSRVLMCQYPSRPWEYAQNFKRILSENGPYDIVHSHIHHFSGYVLRLAAQLGVPMRIAHSHVDRAKLNASASLARRTYLALMERWIHCYASDGLAASEKAAADLFGLNWQNDARISVLYCGVDLDPFRAPIARADLKKEFGISDNSIVIGHVGRFTEVKNHTFLVDVAAEVITQEPRACFVLVGDGPLRPAIEQKVDRMNLRNHFIFTGLRPDIPRLMRGVFDVFLLPSLFEGLPLVLLEAQAAGIPSLISSIVPTEGDVIPVLIKRLSLSFNNRIWSENVLSLYHNAVSISADEALASMEASLFSIQSSLCHLEAVYSHGAVRHKLDPNGIS